ncbi:MAG: branched-chain amino acid ABC transporter permease [Rhodospirillales bacterium]|nr:branched-chain amino acid ABC transporter permease [Rhodospirillales bacterium]
MTTFLQILFGGLSVGAAYGLIALAMVIIYKTSEVLNFAQGDMAMIATFFAHSLLTGQGVSFGWAVAAALLFGIGLAGLAEFLVMRRAKDPNVLGLIIITLGLEMIVFGFASWKWGGDPKDLPIPFGPADGIAIQGVMMSYLELATLAVSALVILALYLFLAHTKAGLAMKAVQQNRPMARLMGVRAPRILMLAWMLAGLAGSVAGLLIAPAGTVDPYMMWDPMLKGFAAAVLGGMTSLPGAALGGALMGIVENLFGYYVSTKFKSVVPFAVILLVLTVRPSGLLARHYVKKV